MIITTTTILFFILQFINVVLSTMKTILTVKANKHVAMLINTITYTFYSGVVKLLTEQDMIIVLAVTFLTNVLGVYLALFILKKCKKDVLWKIEITVPKEETEAVDMCEIPHHYIPVGKHTKFEFYCETQTESKIVKDLVKQHNAKYFVSVGENL